MKPLFLVLFIMYVCLFSKTLLAQPISIDIDGPDKESVFTHNFKGIKGDRLLIAGRVSYLVLEKAKEEDTAYFELVINMLSPEKKDGKFKLVINNNMSNGVYTNLVGDSKGWVDFKIPVLFDPNREIPESLELFVVLKSKGSVRVGNNIKIISSAQKNIWSSFKMIPIEAWWKAKNTLVMVLYVLLAIIFTFLFMSLIALLSYILESKKFMHIFYSLILFSFFVIILAGAISKYNHQPWWVFSTIILFGLLGLLLSLVVWIIYYRYLFKNNNNKVSVF